MHSDSIAQGGTGAIRLQTTTPKRQVRKEIRICGEGPRIRLWINGVQTVDYTEADNSIPQEGQIAVQVHGGGKAEAWFRNLRVEELP